VTGAVPETGPPPYYHRSDCHICLKQDGMKTGVELMDAPIPGGYIVEQGHFLAEHAPVVESSAGTVIVEARRHLLDFGDMTATESAELGSILHSCDQSRHGGRPRLLPGGDGALSPLPPLACAAEGRGPARARVSGAAAPAHVFVQRGGRDLAQDPKRVRAVLTSLDDVIDTVENNLLIG
jgi:hypothetical protein